MNRILQNIAVIAGIILLIVVIILQRQTEKDRDSVDDFYSRIYEFEKENPLSIAVPGDRSDQQLFWNMERNFVFGDVREEEGILHIASSGTEDDNEWLRSTLLKGMKLEIVPAEDPLAEQHSILKEQYSNSEMFYALQDYAEKNENCITLGWNGDLYCYFSKEDTAHIFWIKEEETGTEAAVDIFGGDSRRILQEEVFADREVSFIELLDKKENVEPELTSYTEETCEFSDELKLLVCDAFLEKGILLYQIDSTQEHLSLLDRIVLEYEGDDGWLELKPWKDTRESMILGWPSMPERRISGVIDLGAYQNLGSGHYRLVVDTTDQSPNEMKNGGAAVCEFEIK